MNLDIPYFSLLLLVVFLLERNVDKKSKQTIDARIRVKVEMKVPIEIFFRPTPQTPLPAPKTWPTQKFTPLQKFLTQAEKLIFWPT